MSFSIIEHDDDDDENNNNNNRTIYYIKHIFVGTKSTMFVQVKIPNWHMIPNQTWIVQPTMKVVVHKAIVKMHYISI